MKKLFLALGLMTSALVVNAQMERTVMVGGAAMYPSKNIVQNAVNSKDHTTLVAAVKAADLVSVLESNGPFTVFAPTNAAFDKLPKGTLETLVKPENKTDLTSILTYHVVAGSYDSKWIMKEMTKNMGKLMLTTVQGGKISLMMEGKELVIADQKGNKSKVTIKDVYQSIGVIHVVDTVVMTLWV